MLSGVVGSVLHALKTLEHPRWEDFEYERSDDVKNRLYWLGDGRTSDEKSEDGNSEFSESCRERLLQTG